MIIGIGAQKAGTSWLYRYLASHPQIAMSPLKELHFWDERYRPDLCGAWTDRFTQRLQETANPVLAQAVRERLTMAANEAGYMEYFAKRMRPGAAVFGEVTPSYALLPVEGFRRLKALHDRVKLILILRDPATRFWSGLCHSARRHQRSPEENFAQALHEPRLVERTRYDVTLERLDSVFDARDVLILFYETLFATRDIKPVTDFLGIDAYPAPFEKRVNAVPRPPLSEAHAKLARETFAPVYDYCERRFGAAVPAGWRQDAG